MNSWFKIRPVVGVLMAVVGVVFAYLYASKILSYIEWQDKFNWLVNKFKAKDGIVLEILDQLKKNKERIEIYEKDTENNKVLLEEAIRNLEEIKNRISIELIESQKDIAAQVENNINTSSESTNNFVGEYFSTFQIYLNSLSTVEQGALASIFFALSVYYCTTGIATYYYGDRAIIYFKLEEKYPRLARWIRYRRTVQHYSIGFNILLLYFIAGYVAYVNILIFIGI